MIEYEERGIQIRIPESFMTTSQMVELGGVTYRIPSDEYLISLFPLIKNDPEKGADKDFVRSLNESKRIKFNKRRTETHSGQKLDTYELERIPRKSHRPGQVQHRSNITQLPSISDRIRDPLVHPRWRATGP